MRKLFVALCFLTLGEVQLEAEVSVKDYKQRMGSSNPTVVALTKAYVRGLGEGMSWASSAAQVGGGDGLFCPPQKLALTVENYVDIIDRQIKTARGDVENRYIGELLIIGLQETFPCK
jgi:hypothetical protein